MASKSRWADTEEDAARAARLKREKEAKKLRKAERTKQQDKRETATGLTTAAGRDGAERAAKRQRLTPEAGSARSGHENVRSGGPAPRPEPSAAPARGLLRFEGGTWSSPRPLSAYEKLNEIEEGAYGQVSRARDRETGTVVALKRLKIARTDVARAGLPVTALREMQILRDCDHPNIVGLKEIVMDRKDEEDGDTVAVPNLYLVLEFVEHDLKTLLADMVRPFQPSEVKSLMQQLLAGVGYLHDHWILHRDIKTSNLLLSNRGHLKIADFGISRYVGDPLPQGHHLTSLVVTLWYRAPELLLGATRYGREIDFWSVGCVFAELAAVVQPSGGPLLPGKNEADQLALTFALCGIPTERSWPGFRRLPNARLLKLPPTTEENTRSNIAARFGDQQLSPNGIRLLEALLTLDPARRPDSARDVLRHAYFSEKPLAVPEALFPTFPSRAEGERRRRRRSELDSPPAPVRNAEPGATVGDDGDGVAAGGGVAAPDWSGIFARQLDAYGAQRRGAGVGVRPA